MNEWEILHQVLIKTQIIYPLIVGIIAFCMFEMIVEYKARKEKEKMENKYLLSVTEVMEYTGIGRDRVYQLMRSGQVKTIRIGRYNKIHRLELEKFLDRAAEEKIIL